MARGFSKANISHVTNHGQPHPGTLSVNFRITPDDDELGWEEA